MSICFHSVLFLILVSVMLVLTACNHTCLSAPPPLFVSRCIFALYFILYPGIKVLLDEEIEVDNIRIFGSPWVTQYAYWRTAFNKSPEEMRNHWASCYVKLTSQPDETSSVDPHISCCKRKPLVLLTHTPPKGVGDKQKDGKQAGCPHLLRLVQRLRPILHVFGHVHTDAGLFLSQCHGLPNVAMVNASTVSDYYHVGCRQAIFYDVDPSPQPIHEKYDHITYTQRTHSNTPPTACEETTDLL